MQCVKLCGDIAFTHFNLHRFGRKDYGNKKVQIFTTEKDCILIGL